MPWAVAASVVSAGIGAAASNKASKAQAKSASDATELQREQFEKQVELQEPFRQGGVAANNKLMSLLGLKGPQNKLANGKDALTADQLREELRSNYSKQGTVAASPIYGHGEEGSLIVSPGSGGTDASVDDAALEAAVQARLTTQQQELAAAGSAAENDPEFGSLMRDFSMKDFQEDPGYQFRLAEGQRGLEKSAAARGGLLSGRAAKDMEAYSQGMGAQEWGNAFSRFQINRSNKLNPLQAMAGQGQSSTNVLTSAAQNFGNQASANITGAGNARASGYLNQGNALQNAINGGVSAFKNGQPNQLANYGGWGISGGGGFGTGAGFGNQDYGANL